MSWKKVNKSSDTPKTGGATVFVAELTPGCFLWKDGPDEYNQDDYFDVVHNIWEAYWSKDIDTLEDGIMKYERDVGSFRAPPGYPKFHKVSFSYDIKNTESY